MSCNFTVGNWFMFKQHAKLLLRSSIIWAPSTLPAWPWVHCLGFGTRKQKGLYKYVSTLRGSGRGVEGMGAAAGTSTLNWGV